MRNFKGQYDKIIIRDIVVSCIVGVGEEEKRQKQDIKISVTLFADIKDACNNDNLKQTIDYEKLSLNIINSISISSFNLIEKVAEHTTQICLENSLVQAVKVKVEKTRNFTFANSVCVEIFRKRKQ